MAVTEPQRLDLHTAARTALGSEEGDTLMASLPPANTDIATRQDLERVETSLQKDIANGIATSEARLKTYIWKVVLTSSIVLAIAIVSLTIGGMALLLQVLDVI
jgi:hypothetical protein